MPDAVWDVLLWLSATTRFPLWSKVNDLGAIGLPAAAGDVEPPVRVVDAPGSEIMLSGPEPATR